MTKARLSAGPTRLTWQHREERRALRAARATAMAPNDCQEQHEKACCRERRQEDVVRSWTASWKGSAVHNITCSLWGLLAVLFVQRVAAGGSVTALCLPFSLSLFTLTRSFLGRILG